MKSFSLPKKISGCGISALEIAIIVVAFVVGAAIFAFTVLTTGTFLTERTREASSSQVCLPGWDGSVPLYIMYSSATEGLRLKRVDRLATTSFVGGDCK